MLYIILCMGSIFWADRYHKKIENCFVLTFLSTMLILYIASFLNLLEAAVWGIAMFWILLGGHALWRHRKKEDLFLQQQVATTGFLLFTILFFVFLVFSFNKMLTNWDQYSYWSICTKNTFYNNNWITDVGIQYPPVPIAIEYFFMKIAGEYRQGIEAFALQMLTFSCLLPLFQYTKEKRIQKVAVSILVICVPAIFIMLNFYDSSYPDALMGILLGFMLSTYLLEENKDYRKTVLIMSFIALTLMKSTGVFIAIIGVMILLFYEILSQKGKKPFRKIITSKRIKTCMLLLLIVIGTFISWKVYRTFYSGDLEQASTQAIRRRKR